MAGDRPATRSAACLQKVARAFQHTHRENARSRECVREGKQICHLLRIFLCLFLSVSICLCLSLCLFLSLSLLTHYISHRQGKYEHLPRHGRRLGGCPRHRPRRTLQPAPPAPCQVTVLPSSPCESGICFRKSKRKGLLWLWGEFQRLKVPQNRCPTCYESGLQVLNTPHRKFLLHERMLARGVVTSLDKQKFLHFWTVPCQIHRTGFCLNHYIAITLDRRF